MNILIQTNSAGEGFIIVDQCPTALDESVIACTSTKIVHRLPNVIDYELVGKSMGLTSEQIPEISKLKTGVAAVFQGDWYAPVLCQVPLFSVSEYHAYLPPAKIDMFSQWRVLRGRLLSLLLLAKSGKSFSDCNLSEKQLSELALAIPEMAKRQCEELQQEIRHFKKNHCLSIWQNDQELVSLIQTILPYNEIVVIRNKNKGIKEVLNTMKILLRKDADFNGDPIVESLTLTALIGSMVKENETLNPIWEESIKQTQQLFK